MAAAPAPADILEAGRGVQLRLPLDLLQIFSCRQNGCLPSIGLASVEGEPRRFGVHGLGFEPIFPSGTIHAFKSVEEFQDVQWAGQYNPNKADRLELRDIPAEIPDQTITWANIISYVYNAAYATFRRDGHRSQRTLYQAMKDKSINLHNPEVLKWMIMQNRPIPRDLQDKLQDQHNEDIVEDLLSIFVKGFGSCQAYSIPRFLRQSVPNIGVVAGFGLAHTRRGSGTSGFTIPPADTSDDNLPSGVLHCLVYGFTEDMEEDDLEDEEGTEDRGRPRYREVLQKRSGGTDTDRSRSDSYERAEVDDIKEGDGGPDGRTFLSRDNLTDAVDQGDPGNFFVNISNIAKFTECHKPDAMLIHYFDRSRPIATCFEVKLVLVIAGVNRYGDVSFPTHVRKATSECVWSCLAALQQTQTKILGLCAMINGFKLIKIVKNGHGWTVFESQVASFENADGIVKFLCTLNEELALD